MHIHDISSIPKESDRQAIMRGHNLMQVQLIIESGMDEIEWVDTFAADFRAMVTESPHDSQRTLLIKRAIAHACEKNDIPSAVGLVRQLYPDFPFQAAA